MRREQRAGSFAEPQAEIEQRLHAEQSQHRRVRALVRAVREEEVIADVRMQLHGDSDACGGDEAVDDERNLSRGRTEGETGDCGDLESAEGGEDFDGRGRLSYTGEGQLDRFDFAMQRRVVDAGAA